MNRSLSRTEAVSFQSLKTVTTLVITADMLLRCCIIVRASLFLKKAALRRHWKARKFELRHVTVSMRVSAYRESPGFQFWCFFKGGIRRTHKSDSCRSQDNYSTIGPASPLVVDFKVGGWLGNCTGNLTVGWRKRGQRLTFFRA
ncbi:hypothetical protein TNCV_2201631 [Trichonephila clavipes]|nr:hypothetical protein TNCV_2201631 [Trichonephila clavipes]